MSRLVRLVPLAGILTLTSSACIRTTHPVEPPGEITRGEIARDEWPNATDADVAQVVADDRGFAFDLYQNLRKLGQADAKPANLFFSPYSISTALAMTYAGARGQTAEQMAKALHFTLPPERLHPAVNSVDLRLVRLMNIEKGPGAFRLHVVNHLWGQVGAGFLPEFLALLGRHYGAGLSELDLEQQPDKARRLINDWVAGQTEKRITDLLPPDSITHRTRLILTSAVYFQADWQQTFEKGRTRQQPFHLLDGENVAVPMMQQHKNLRHFGGDGLQAVELPYGSGTIAMLIIVPNAGRFADVEADCSATRLDGVVAGFELRGVELQMPKFAFTSAVALKNALRDLGMPDALSPTADFSGMNAKTNLFLADVYHKAFVRVDEKGTEAAAATAARMEAKAEGPNRGVTLTIDRPFIFLIRDTRSGVILFMGRVLDPRG